MIGVFKQTPIIKTLIISCFFLVLAQKTVTMEDNAVINTENSRLKETINRRVQTICGHMKPYIIEQAGQDTPMDNYHQFYKKLLLGALTIGASMQGMQQSTLGFPTRDKGSTQEIDLSKSKIFDKIQNSDVEHSANPMKQSTHSALNSNLKFIIDVSKQSPQQNRKPIKIDKEAKKDFINGYKLCFFALREYRTAATPEYQLQLSGDIHFGLNGMRSNLMLLNSYDQEEQEEDYNNLKKLLKQKSKTTEEILKCINRIYIKACPQEIPIESCSESQAQQLHKEEFQKHNVAALFKAFEIFNASAQSLKDSKIEDRNPALVVSMQNSIDEMIRLIQITKGNDDSQRMKELTKIKDQLEKRSKPSLKYIENWQKNIEIIKGYSIEDNTILEQSTIGLDSDIVPFVKTGKDKTLVIKKNKNKIKKHSKQKQTNSSDTKVNTQDLNATHIDSTTQTNGTTTNLHPLEMSTIFQHTPSGVPITSNTEQIGQQNLPQSLLGGPVEKIPVLPQSGKVENFDPNSEENNAVDLNRDINGKFVEAISLQDITEVKNLNNEKEQVDANKQINSSDTEAKMYPVTFEYKYVDQTNKHDLGTIYVTYELTKEQTLNYIQENQLVKQGPQNNSFEEGDRWVKKQIDSSSSFFNRLVPPKRPLPLTQSSTLQNSNLNSKLHNNDLNSNESEKLKLEQIRIKKEILEIWETVDKEPLLIGQVKKIKEYDLPSYQKLVEDNFDKNDPKAKKYQGYIRLLQEKAEHLKVVQNKLKSNIHARIAIINSNQYLLDQAKALTSLPDRELIKYYWDENDEEAKELQGHFNQLQKIKKDFKSECQRYMKVLLENSSKDEIQKAYNFLEDIRILQYSVSDKIKLAFNTWKKDSNNKDVLQDCSNFRKQTDKYYITLTDNDLPTEDRKNAFKFLSKNETILSPAYLTFFSKWKEDSNNRTVIDEINKLIEAEKNLSKNHLNNQPIENKNSVSIQVDSQVGDFPAEDTEKRKRSTSSSSSSESFDEKERDESDLTNVTHHSSKRFTFNDAYFSSSSSEEDSDNGKEKEKVKKINEMSDADLINYLMNLSPQEINNNYDDISKNDNNICKQFVENNLLLNCLTAQYDDSKKELLDSRLQLYFEYLDKLTSNPFFIPTLKNLSEKQAENLRNNLISFSSREDFKKSYLPKCNELTQHNKIFDLFGYAVNELKYLSPIQEDHDNETKDILGNQAEKFLSLIVKATSFEESTESFKKTYDTFKQLDLRSFISYMKEPSKICYSLANHNQSLKAYFNFSNLMQVMQYKNSLKNNSRLKQFDNIYDEDLEAFDKLLRKDMEIIQDQNIAEERYLSDDSVATNAFNNLKKAQQNGALAKDVETKFEQFKKEQPNAFKSTYRWWKPWTWRSNTVEAPQKQEPVHTNGSATLNGHNGSNKKRTNLLGWFFSRISWW